VSEFQVHLFCKSVGECEGESKLIEIKLVMSLVHKLEVRVEMVFL
jgi:hypothetical protein